MTADDLVEAKLGVMGVPFQRKRPDGSPMFTRAFLGLAQVAMDGNPPKLLNPEPYSPLRKRIPQVKRLTLEAF